MTKMIEYIPEAMRTSSREIKPWLKLFPVGDKIYESRKIIVSFCGNDIREGSLTELDWSALEDIDD